ncbi:hypothetical protein K2173_011389 [Erythroxylum novogranatense]|uniref:Cytochrome b5 heme-binding domain-containing protein n=1 Tax=Erythroxylum novogranatense TaxID=1862640 RepID=A0AAV8S4Q7_9ROSI|nr:hypothetical protein K2173_011389 [Erythroxylum novogranatense]
MAPIDSGTAVKISQGLKVSARKTAPRAKVPFEKGYSQMDWLRLTQTHPDLAGLRGQSNRRNISMSEVKEHIEEGSMWTVLKGRVYNLSPYMKFHPGGADMLMKVVRRDCTVIKDRNNMVEYLTIKYPSHLWKNLQERYHHQKEVLLKLP